MANPFVPDMWSKQLLDKFTKATVFGSSVNRPFPGYMYGRTPLTDWDEIMRIDDWHEKKERQEEWYGVHAEWTKVFAWWPKDTNAGKVWLRPVMRGSFNFGTAKARDMFFTVPFWVAMKLDGRIGAPT